MGGIVSGLTSIVPIMPEQSTITDKSGVKGPPVEIMPLPSNSFMSDGATTELLNNPFTLSLDIKGHNEGDANGGKAVGRVASQAGSTIITNDDAADALLNHAYTLSLGNEENVPIATEIAREMSRMRNYEMLGKNATRQIYRMNPETGAAEHITAQTQNKASIEMISEKVRSLLSQSLAEQNEAIAQVTAQNGEIKTMLPQMRGASLTSRERLSEGSANTPQTAQLAGTPATADIRQDISRLSNLAAVQLSASDIETILALEPDLQDALMNMLSSVNTSGSGKMTLAAPNELLNNGKADETTGGNNAQSRQGAPPENSPALIDKNLLINAQPGIIRQTLNNISRPPNASEIKLITDTADNARVVALTDEELWRLTADALAGGKVFSALSQSTLRGSIQNLQKVNELPYALYIFGNVNPDNKGEFEEEDDIAISEEPGARKTGPAEFLRISEAIKMASVLHNIYYGGSGRFPREMPWYAPYVRYAIKNGIIKNREFDDYNELATRAETVYIFSGCVPKAEFPIINFVSDIPDVSETIGYGDSIYLLYRAGVLKKSDKKGSFHPESMITKTEAATIIGRIATPDDRKRIL